MKKFNHEYFKRNLRNGGEQYLYKFPNNYGASVVRNDFSYGGDNGLWELAVIVWDKDGSWDLNYLTEITNDVIGYLTENVVESLLDTIEQL